MFASTIQKGKLVCMPDVCKTPTPGGPVPIPYPNSAMTTLANPAVVKVIIAGSPAINKGCKIQPTTGDTAGTLGGVSSNTTMAKAQFTTSSSKVYIGGKPAIRQMDQGTSNNGNTIGVQLEPSQTKVILG